MTSVLHKSHFARTKPITAEITRISAANLSCLAQFSTIMHRIYGEKHGPKLIMDCNKRCNIIGDYETTKGN